jgi:hypothetical protein
MAGAFAAACGLASGLAITVFLEEAPGAAGAFMAAAFGAGFLSDVCVSADALTALISRGVRDFGARSPFDAIVAVLGVVFSVLAISGTLWNHMLIVDRCRQRVSLE